MITMADTNLNGVFSAAITPIRADLSPDLDAIPNFLDFLAKRGCHGALLLGTTGEGPSFSPEQRREILSAAVEIRQVRPEFHLLAGTGTPSLDETVSLTHSAFDLGFDGVVVLPPYYYRKAGDEGLYTWFRMVIQRAVPKGGRFYGYHIPAVSGVGLSIELLSRLKDTYPEQFAGLKDSSGDPENASALINRFGNSLEIFTGNDRLLSLAISVGMSGCITAMANLMSPRLRQIWDAFHNGKPDLQSQEYINAARTIFDQYPPAPALIKALLNRAFGFSRWSVCPPLQPIRSEIEDQAFTALNLA